MKSRLQAVVGKVKPPSRFSKKILLRLGLAAMVIIGVCLWLFVFDKPQEQAIINEKRCSNDILTDAAKILETNEVIKLKIIAEKVQKIEKFDQDLNCLYLVLIYSINFDDSSKAHEFLNKYEKLYNQINGLNPLLGNSIKTLEQLKADLKFNDDVRQQLEKNTLGAPSGPPNNQ